jgi:hypothetical protein
MTEVGSRKRHQPAPCWVVFEDLCDPHREPARPWLDLLDDEVEPEIVDAVRPHYVIWSSLWANRPDACVRFDLAAARGGTDLRWTLFVGDPVPDIGMINHMRQRIGELINANLRYTYGQ